MKAATLLRIKELFLAASDLPPDERSAFLDAQPNLSPEARAQIDEQLAILERADDSSLAHRLEMSPDTEDPKQIGPYTVVRRIGEGGMGVVFLAEQHEPIHRMVAVKRVRAGMDSRAMLERFEAERMALARMDHPAIARVLDAGIDAEGRPFFAMEFVEGVSILEYCDSAALDPDARLLLFAEVCRGVQHAHQKGVIHRDLKPSNVLVTTIDGRPCPKIIDFGVAKALERERTEQTLQTQFGMMIGTPEYMSPEQAEPGAADVDTRSDVYSLGVLLYELLSGELPFEPSYLRERGLAGIQEVLRQEEPPKPSTRVGRARTTEQARRRRLEPATLAQRLRGDLDWITMRALEKDRDRRYSSAGEFAADVERHLRHEPVAAGPPKASYRLKKFLRRHRLQAASVGLIALALLAGTGVALAFAHDARRERDRALSLASERDAARREAVSTIESVRATLGRSARRLESAFSDGDASPKAQAEAHTMLGETLIGIGDLEAAQFHLESALDLLRDVPESWPDQAYRVLQAYDQVRMVGTGWGRGAMLRELHQRTQAAVLAQDDPKLGAALDQFLSYGGVDIELGNRRFDALMAIAESSFEVDDPRWSMLTWLVTESLGSYRDRSAWIERLSETPAWNRSSSNDLVRWRARLRCIQHLNYPYVGRRREALALAETTLEEVQGLLRADHYLIGLFELERGYALNHLGEFELAWPALARAAEILEGEFGPDKSLTVWALLAQVQFFDQQGQSETHEARQLREEFAQRVARCFGYSNLEWVESALQPDDHALLELLHEYERVWPDVAPSLSALSRAAKLALDSFPPGDPRLGALAPYMSNEGESLVKHGAEPAQMIEFYEQILRMTSGHPSWQGGLSRWWLANLHFREGNYQRSVEISGEGLDGKVEGLDPGYEGMLTALHGIGRYELGEQEEGIAQAIEGYRMCSQVLGDQNGNVRVALGRIATRLRAMGRRNEAVGLFVELVRRQSSWHSSVQTIWHTAHLAWTGLESEAPALAILPDLRERYPDAWQTSDLEARLAAVRFDLAAGQIHAQVVVEAMDEEPFRLNAMAKVLATLGDIDSADRIAKRAFEVNGSAALRNNRAVWLLSHGDYERAQALLEAGVADEPDYAYYHANLTHAFLGQGEVARAMASASTAYQLAPELSHAVMGRALLAQGDFERASSKFADAARTITRPTGHPRIQEYVDALFRTGRLDEARSYLEDLTAEWPTEPFAWSQRSLALSRYAAKGDRPKQDRSTALACAERAVELTERRGPFMLASLAEAAFRAGDAERALRVCDEALELMDGRNAAWLSLEEVRESRDRYAAAR